MTAGAEASTPSRQASPERAFFDQYHRALMRYLARRVGSPLVAEDLSQLVWAGFLLKRGWEHATPVRLLYLIARRRVVDWYRNQPPEDPVPDCATALANKPSRTGQDPEAIDLRVDVERELRRWLTRKQQTVIILRYYYDLSRVATADLMKIDPRTVGFHETAALANLRKSEILAQYRKLREGERP